MLTSEQLSARKAGLGGSDLGAVLGFSPYSSPLDVYNEKLGLVEPPDLSANEAVHFGNVLEDVVASEFSRRTGLKVRRNNKHLAHKTHPILLANIDREIVGKVGGLKAGLECKTAGAFAAKGDLWGPGAEFSVVDGELIVAREDDVVPAWYLLQCAHYMAVTDSDLWFLAVLVGGNDFRMYIIRRDPDLEKELVTQAQNFWDFHISAAVPPEWSNAADLNALYPRDNGESAVADLETVHLAGELGRLKRVIKEAEIEVKGTKSAPGLETQLKAAFGENAELLVDESGSVLASWKTQETKRLDGAALKKAHPDLHAEFCKTTTNRVLRLK